MIEARLELREPGQSALSLVLSHHRTVEVFDAMDPAETAMLLVQCVVGGCEPASKAYGRPAEAIAREGICAFANLLESEALPAFLLATYGEPGEPGQRVTIGRMEAMDEETRAISRVDITSAQQGVPCRQSTIVTTLIEGVAGIAAFMERPPAEFLRGVSATLVDGASVSWSGDAAVRAKLDLLAAGRGRS
jgi:hypothetical protein